MKATHENRIKSKMQDTYTESKASNIEHALTQGLNGREGAFDLYREERICKLRQEYQKRNGAQAIDPHHVISPQFVIQQAAERYFELVNGAMKEMQKMFTEEELRIVLNCTNAPLLSWRYGSSFANMVANEHEIEDLHNLQDGTAIKLLLLKLLELNTAQSLALTDLCETFWRAPHSGSLSQICETLGLELADEA